MTPQGRDADSFYVADCRQAQENTHSIQTLTGQISRMIGTLQTDKEFFHCRKMVDDAVRQASETQLILRRVQEHQRQAQNASERSNRRMMYHKLSDNLAITARVLEDVVRRFTQEEQRMLAKMEDWSAVPMKGVSSHNGGLQHHMSADAAAGEDQPLVQPGHQLQASEEIDDLEVELRRDRCQAMRRVDEDMRCLQRIYADLAAAADDQRASFDSLESQMASASVDIERGREEIQRGYFRWDRTMKHRIWAALGAAAAIVVTTVVITSS